MARPERNNIDYFPHPCHSGRKMNYIIKKYGPEGYFIWYRLLELLGAADFHYLNLSEKTQLMLTSSDLNTSETRLTEVLNDLAEFNSINKKLWVDFRVVFSEKFVKEIQDAYSRRINKCVTLDDLCKQLSIKLSQKPNKNTKTVYNKPQSKVKERIYSSEPDKQARNHHEENPDLRPHKEVLEDVIEFFSMSPATKSDWARVGKLASDFRKKKMSLKSLKIRADLYQKEWPNITLTPEALLKHWDHFGEKEKKILEAERRRIETEQKRRQELEDVPDLTQEEKAKFSSSWKEALNG